MEQSPTAKASTETSRNAPGSVLTIGKLAERTQVTTDSIRYYERERLIKPARKSESGYRLYTDEAIRRIEFIKHAQQCGFTLAEVRQLLDLRSTDRACCDDIYKVSVEKRSQLEHKITALKTMSEALSRLIDMCSHDQASLDECPILGALEVGLAPKQGLPADARVRVAKGRAKAKESDMKTVDLTIDGMHCESCAKTIEAVLGAEPGVKAANVSHAAQRARVMFDPAAIDVAGLVKAVERAGYHVS